MTRRIHRRWRHMAQAKAPAEAETPAQKAERARQEQAAAHDKAVMKLVNKVGRHTKGYSRFRITDLWKHFDETPNESLIVPYIGHVLRKAILRQARRGRSWKKRRADILERWQSALDTFRELASQQQRDKNPELRAAVESFVSGATPSSDGPARQPPGTPTTAPVEPRVWSRKAFADDNYNRRHRKGRRLRSLADDGAGNNSHRADQDVTPVSRPRHTLTIRSSPSNTKPHGSEPDPDDYSEQDDPDHDSEPALAPEDDEPPASASWTDPLHGVIANLAATDEDGSGDHTATKPFDFCRRRLRQTGVLIQERALEGRIKINPDTVQAVDRLYPEARQLRHSDLDLFNPASKSSDERSAEHVASLHNLYIELRRRRWVWTDDLIHGMLLSLFGRDDVFILGIDLQVNSDTDAGAYDENIFRKAGSERRYHVVPININKNHFAVVIGDREEGRACYFDGYHQDDAAERDEVLGRVNEHYWAFLGLIGAPEIELRYGRAPNQPDAHSCGLIALEMVRYVFRELGGDLATAEEQDFSLAGAVTRTVSRGPWAGGGDDELLEVLLQAWLLWIERELGGDGSGRVLDGELLSDEEPQVKGAPRVYKKGVRLRGERLPNSADMFFAAFPADIIDNLVKSNDFRKHLTDEALVENKFVTSGDNHQRLEDLAQAHREKFGQHDIPFPPKDGNLLNLPILHIFDDLTGLPLTERGPHSSSADANSPFAFSNDKLSRHLLQNTTAIAQCTNWTKAKQFTCQDLAAADLLHDKLHDRNTPWEERKPEFQFASNCLDNLAAARQTDPCRSNKVAFEGRCADWAKQEPADLEESARFWARPTRDSEYMKKRIGEQVEEKGVLQNAGFFLSLGLEHYLRTDKSKSFARDAKRKEESASLHKEMRAAAKAEGLSDQEFETYFLHHGVYFPFHISSRNHLKREADWDTAHLVALARSEAEDGVKVCNRAAIGQGLGEPDLCEQENWARVIFPIFLAGLKKLIQVRKDLRDHWRERGWGPTGVDYEAEVFRDGVFMDEVAHLLTDEMGFPILPFLLHILRCTHEKRFDPRDIMLSGYGRGPNGRPFESTGPFTHSEDFHLMRSFVPWARTMLFSSYLTNMIRGKEHSSLWPRSLAILMSIPPDGPLSKLEASLGEEPWFAADPEAFRGTPPGRTFDIDIPLPPVEDLVFHRQGSQGSIRLGCPSCQGGEHQGLTPGALLNHYLIHHSPDTGHRCEHCGVACFSDNALKFHLGLCFKDRHHLQDAYKHYRDLGHHADGGEDCQFRPGDKRMYTAGEKRMHLQACGKSLAERLEGQFCCECGLAYSEHYGHIVQHQASNVHKAEMAYRNDPSIAGSRKPCDKCGILLGATPFTNREHKKYCENAQEVIKDPKRFNIVLDGTAGQKGQTGQDARLKPFQNEAERLAGRFVKQIGKHAPPGSLPKDGVCGICLQKQKSNHPSHKNLHKETPGHQAAHALLKRLYPGNVPEDDEKPADKKRLSELLSGLQAVYHGQDAAQLPQLLELLFTADIPPDASPAKFRQLARDHKYLKARYPRGKSGGKKTILQRMLEVDRSHKPGGKDCVDCCVFGLFNGALGAARSQHTFNIKHIGAHGFVDGMLKLMDPGASRFEAVLEVQRRFNESDPSDSDPSDSDPSDSGSDNSGQPPLKKTQLSTPSAAQVKKPSAKPAARAKKLSAKTTAQVKKPSAKPTTRAKKPSAKPAAQVKKPSANKGKSAVTQATNASIKSYFPPLTGSKRKHDLISGEDDEEHDGEDDGDEDYEDEDDDEDEDEDED